jgi:hypothetical protein
MVRMSPSIVANDPLDLPANLAKVESQSLPEIMTAAHGWSPF